MKTLIQLLILSMLASCGSDSSHDSPNTMNYEKKLVDVKQHYPFEEWKKAYANGLEQYTEENCNKMKAIFDRLIAQLIAKGENAGEAEKVALFKTAIEATNALNDESDGTLIETGEREELCELTDRISVASGIDPKKYGDGEGLASEWREW